MKSATNTRSSELPTTSTAVVMSLPEFAPNDVTAGVDWARDDHAVSVVNGRGREVYRCSVEHTAAGLRELIKALGGHGVSEVAIERPDGPVVDALLAAGVTVVVVSPNQVKNLRGRYGSAGNKDDRFDAYVLADTLRTDPLRTDPLRTDRARLRPLVPDTEPTIALRRACRARKDLVKHRVDRVAAANQLRAHLRNTFPGAVSLFADIDSDIDSEITLAFLTRFDTQDRADWLTPQRLGDWLAKQGYSGKVDPTVPHQRLLDAARGATGATGATGAHATSQAPITASYVALLRTLLKQIKTLSTQIDRQLHAHTDAHTDAHIFTSLPRSGRIRAARLLTEIGDCRARFPTPESLTCLTCLAGAAPSTRQSGTLRTVGFRWSCDKQLRDAVVDFAADTRHTNPWAANPWAADLYTRARTRGHDHAHAVRILARAWLHIIWHCWQQGVAYNPNQHRALQRLLATQTAAG